MRKAASGNQGKQLTLSFYYSFYKNLWDAGHYEGMALLGLQNIDNPQIKKEGARNKRSWKHLPAGRMLRLMAIATKKPLYVTVKM